MLAQTATRQENDNQILVVLWNIRLKQVRTTNEMLPKMRGATVEARVREHTDIER